jgi:hypothetical protein
MLINRFRQQLPGPSKRKKRKRAAVAAKRRGTAE